MFCCQLLAYSNFYVLLLDFQQQEPTFDPEWATKYLAQYLSNSSDMLYCPVCDVPFTSLHNKQQHCLGRKHNKEVVTFVQKSVKMHQIKNGILSVAENCPTNVNNENSGKTPADHMSNPTNHLVNDASLTVPTINHMVSTEENVKNNNVDHMDNGVHHMSNGVHHMSNDVDHDVVHMNGDVHMNDVDHMSNDVDHMSNGVNQKNSDVDHLNSNMNNDVDHMSNSIDHMSNNVNHMNNNVDHMDNDVNHMSNDDHMELAKDCHTNTCNAGGHMICAEHHVSSAKNHMGGTEDSSAIVNTSGPDYVIPITNNCSEKSSSDNPLGRTNTSVTCTKGINSTTTVDNVGTSTSQVIVTDSSIDHTDNHDVLAREGSHDQPVVHFPPYYSLNDIIHDFTVHQQG